MIKKTASIFAVTVAMILGITLPATASVHGKEVSLPTVPKHSKIYNGAIQRREPLQLIGRYWICDHVSQSYCFYNHGVDTHETIETQAISKIYVYEVKRLGPGYYVFGTSNGHCLYATSHQFLTETGDSCYTTKANRIFILGRNSRGDYWESLAYVGRDIGFWNAASGQNVKVQDPGTGYWWHWALIGAG